MEPARLLEALDQLLAHESWRDTKAALILLHRGQGFSHAIELMREAIKSHSNFKRELPQLSETPFLFAQRNDRSRETLVTTLVVDLPQVDSI